MRVKRASTSSSGARSLLPASPPKKTGAVRVGHNLRAVAALRFADLPSESGIALLGDGGSSWRVPDEPPQGLEHLQNLEHGQVVGGAEHLDHPRGVIRTDGFEQRLRPRFAARSSARRVSSPAARSRFLRSAALARAFALSVRQFGLLAGRAVMRARVGDSFLNLRWHGLAAVEPANDCPGARARAWTASQPDDALRQCGNCRIRPEHACGLHPVVSCAHRSEFRLEPPAEMPTTEQPLNTDQIEAALDCPCVAICRKSDRILLPHRQRRLVGAEHRVVERGTCGRRPPLSCRPG